MNAVSSKKSFFQLWLILKPWQRIMIGLVAGIVTGLVFGHKALALKPIGSIFINAIHMMVIPVHYTAIVCAIITIGNDAKKMQRVGFKTIALYTISMAISAVIGLTVATYLSPGAGLHLAATTSSVGSLAMPTVPILLSIWFLLIR